MSEREWEAAGAGRFETLGWRSIAAGFGLLAVGLVVGATLFGVVGETPCYEVEERAQPALDAISATFGDGEEGRQAISDWLELAQAHPSCFDPAYVELLQSQLQSSSDAPQTVPTATLTPIG